MFLFSLLCCKTLSSKIGLQSAATVMLNLPRSCNYFDQPNILSLLKYY